ncbi:hypothetical protein L486_07754 [Kwoniella mangroviensis CBS 10435]|uniref:Uncharacterized protein n=1 Tax=Kwoniella mangroviensis CBS 10435 TaxID=1331196 RepID=A0A1B9IGH7_9TREE|nr:hypothetical protein L486_07754 [Kwoniella mangroviensis CBS 10435]
MAPHPSVSPSFSSISPKPPAPDPNINSFSPLSPDLPENTLNPSNGEDQVTRLLGIELSSPHKDLIIYTRRDLLRIGKSSRQHGPPPGMNSLDTWFGAAPKANVQHVDDPAIASIEPPSSTSRRGGFGEGFGYGGGIGGGRGLGVRGGRNIGLRRQPETSLDANGLPIDNRSYGGQMGRFSVRNPGTMRLGGDEIKRDKRREDEWRRSDRDNGRGGQRDLRDRDTRRPNNYTREEHTSEPAWMDDAAPVDPAIVDNTDPLVQFIPGEDMIAAHKRAMKARDVGGDWRGDGHLPAFFGGDPAIASSSAPAPPPGLIKPKSFNAADYLKQAEDLSDEEIVPQPVQPAPPASAFSSRFQKFFSPAQEAAPVVEARPLDEVKDDRTAKLMGLLSSKTSPPPEQVYTPSPSEQLRHLSSPPPSSDGQPSQFSPNYYDPSGGPLPPPSHANALLQQLYGNAQERQPPPPDPLQLLNQAQRQGSSHPRAPHMSLPPQFARPPPNMNMFPQQEENNMNQGYPPHFGRQPNVSHGPLPPGFMPPPPPQFFQQGAPPRPHGYAMPNFPPQHPPQHLQHPQQPVPPRPYPHQPLGSAQQDMLATLFAGLGPR